MEVEREQPIPMICVCVMGWGGMGDSCGMRTSGPDEPVCDACVRSGHPESPAFQPRIKQRKADGQ